MKVLGVVVVIILLLLIGIGMYVSVKNTLVSKNEAVKSTWSQVDVVLQRRADLIPNLVETVKGITKQEQAVFGEIAEARSRLLSASSPADKIAANQRLDGALGRLLAISENYPQLKSNENFLRLQDELAGTENRIAVGRRRYNDAVTKYNADMQQFPANMAASLFGFQREDAYFNANPEAKTAPSVKF